ncbi:hypothetical protein AB0G71_14900 [Streptomyces sp. NPDC020403]|uniref:hypothetical protein n=1 Tax=unclassified Streptomyces TaxID=2593676 RepID=UPI003401CFC8
MAMLDEEAKVSGAGHLVFLSLAERARASCREGRVTEDQAAAEEERRREGDV